MSPPSERAPCSPQRDAGGAAVASPSPFAGGARALSWIRLADRWLAFLFACVLATAGAAARELIAIDGTRLDLQERINAPNTLLLVARSEADLLEAFRLLTLAEIRDLPTLILVELPAGQKLKNASLRAAARRFVQSDFSRRRLYFTEADASGLSLSQQRSLLVDASLRTLWHSPQYPEDAQFDSEPFLP